MYTLVYNYIYRHHSSNFTSLNNNLFYTTGFSRKHSYLRQPMCLNEDVLSLYMYILKVYHYMYYRKQDIGRIIVLLKSDEK